MIKAAEARIAAAEQHIKLVSALYQRGTVSADRLREAYRTLFVAQREAPLSPAKLLDAAKKYRDQAAAGLKSAEARYRTGSLSEVDVLAVRLVLAEADFWLAEARGRAGSSAADLPKSIGSATMRADGTIELQLRATGAGGVVGDGLIRYPKSHAQYKMVLKHVGGLKPGETKACPPFPD